MAPRRRRTLPGEPPPTPASLKHRIATRHHRTTTRTETDIVTRDSWHGEDRGERARAAAAREGAGGRRGVGRGRPQHHRAQGGASRAARVAGHSLRGMPKLPPQKRSSRTNPFLHFLEFSVSNVDGMALGVGTVHTGWERSSRHGMRRVHPRPRLRRRQGAHRPPRLPHPPGTRTSTSVEYGRGSTSQQNRFGSYSTVFSHRTMSEWPTLPGAVRTREVYDTTTPDIVASVVGGINGRAHTRRILLPALATSLLSTCLECSSNVYCPLRTHFLAAFSSLA